MKIKVKLLFLTVFFCFTALNNCCPFDLDETVDDEIRKNYNSSKLIIDTGIETKKDNHASKIQSGMPEEDLPGLPEITKHQEKQTSVETKPYYDTVPPSTIISSNKGNIKIGKGTTFYVTSSNALSDRQKSGTTVKFVTKKVTQGKNYKLPAWTSFNGEIIESHQPQITCNGGLVSLRIYSMTYKGQIIPINAYVIRANDKKVFFNDIKGQRTYLKTMWKKGNWGRSIFSRMMTLTVKLGGEGSTLILSPFPALYGTLCLGLNTLTSPITAFFSKGGHVSIPAGSQFKIKLLEDAFVD